MGLNLLFLPLFLKEKMTIERSNIVVSFILFILTITIGFQVWQNKKIYTTRNQEVGRNCLSQCHGKVWIKTYVEGNVLKCICEEK